MLGVLCSDHYPDVRWRYPLPSSTSTAMPIRVMEMDLDLKRALLFVVAG
ncbi:MAG: hypothetical protein AB7T32_17665 [Dehalococcoidia bacterium]